MKVQNTFLALFGLTMVFPIHWNCVFDRSIRLFERSLFLVSLFILPEKQSMHLFHSFSSPLFDARNTPTLFHLVPHRGITPLLIALLFQYAFFCNCRFPLFRSIEDQCWTLTTFHYLIVDQLSEYNSILYI